MGRKLTQEEFISRSAEVHNNKYDYSLVKYVDTVTKVRIICPNHGIFEQTPKSHLKGRGCLQCANEYKSSLFVGDQDDVIASFRTVHGTKYDYSKVIYKRSKDKVEIICPQHGSFWQSPNRHKSGQGCPECANERLAESKFIPIETILESFREVHGDKYDYSKFVYVGDKDKSIIICPEHGEFLQAAGHHKRGQGCPGCKPNSISSKKTKTLDQVITGFKEIHGDKYDYSKFIYQGGKVKGIIICPEHGEFEQIPNSHLMGKGCHECGFERSRVSRLVGEEEFLNRAKASHGERYTYIAESFSKMHEKVGVVCPIHGDFYQTAEHHTNGVGCPTCASGSQTSKPENEIFEFVSSICQDAEQGTRKIIPPKELDIYVPSKSLAIELNGIYYHSDQKKDRRYHFNKWKECKEKGIRLIQITDYEWETNKDKFKGIISNALGLNTNSDKKVNARQCTIEKLTASECKDFFNANHPQGHTGNPENYALRDKEGCVVAIMSFGKNKTSRGLASTTGTWELSRYATACSVRGGASKLFKAFIAEHNPETVKSFSMNDWFSGGVYEVLGFDGEIIAPDYKVYHPKIGLSPKSAWQRRNIPRRLEEIGSSITYSPETDERTEWQMEDLVGAYRVWDSGKIRWVWKNPNINSNENSQE